MRFSSRQLEHELRRRITNAQYGVGSRLPSERDLAEELGCSRSTVSKVMERLQEDGLVECVHGAGNFVTERRQLLVQPLAESQPGVAGKPSGGRIVKYLSPIIDVRVVNSRNVVLEGLHEVFNPAGYDVGIDFFASDDDYLACLKRLAHADTAGVVLWARPGERAVRVIRDLQKSGVNVVMVDSHLPEIDCDYVVSDNMVGAQQLVRYLVEKGHRELCYFTAPPRRVTSLQDRLSGFLRGCYENGVRFGNDSIIEVNGGLAGQLDGVLARKNRPTAILASHDTTAISVLELLTARGIKVPEELAVTGHDGIESGELVTPSLTTMKQDFKGMAVGAAQILLERLNGTAGKRSYRQTVAPKLVVRKSA